MKLRLLTLCCFLLSCVAIAQPHTDFIQNKGQWGSWIKYKATTLGGEVQLERDGLRYILCDDNNKKKMDSVHLGSLARDKAIMKFHVYKMNFVGAREAKITGQKQQKHYYNYFLGNDRSRWASEIHPYLSIDYNDLYEGINLHVTAEDASLIYEFFVAPGADAAKVQLQFDGPESMRLNDGNLLINTSVGQVQEMKPVAFQYINNEKVNVPCKYRLKNNVLSFDFPEDYNHGYQLIIDPTIVFCSFTGSTADNWGFTATPDDSGNFYMGGLVNGLIAGTDFPVSPGAYQSVFAGGQSLGGGTISYASDLGIMKLSPDGTSRIYATYIGGAANERPHSMIIEPTTGNLFIAGKTRSTNYPVTPGAYQGANAGEWDMFVSKLNSAGTALLASTYVGGTGDDGNNFDSTEVGYGHLKYNYGDDARSEIQIDNAGNVYVAGCTNSTNFPTVSAFAGAYGGGLQDGVIFKLNNNLTNMLWSTYVGGSGDDACYVLTFNSTQTAVYVAGGTNSTNFPVGGGGWQTTYQGDSADGFILRFQNVAPYNVTRGTFVGTAGFDQVYGIQTDNSNNVYLMGQSNGGLFPVTAGVYTNPNSTQFVMKMDQNLTADLISTVYGSGNSTQTNISPVAFLVDTCENIYISGWGGNIMGVASLAHTGVTTGMPTTSDAVQSTTDGFDFYFIVLGPGMTSLRYATFYGRNAVGGLGEHVDGGTSRFSKKGIIYQAICANCGGPTSPAFPTTPGVWAPTVMSNNCNEAGLKIAFNIGPVEANICTVPPDDGCAPLTIAFNNCSNNSLSFVWNFGDGSPTTTAYAPTHTFTSGGVYTVTLSAANSNACFTTNDTAYLVIVVDTGRIIPEFTHIVLDSCGPYAAQFTNTSQDLSGGTPTYHWYFGDGTDFIGDTPGLHIYPDTGTYYVTLVMTDTAACNSPDTVIHPVRIHSVRVSANFMMPDSVCQFTAFAPTSSPINATDAIWVIQPGNDTLHGTAPTINFGVVGTYTITCIAENPGSCNEKDSLTRVIKVIPVPTAAFIYAPITPEPNIPSSFTNQSVNATRYLWDFGDNSTSVETHPVHQYNKTGNYTVCLNAYNSSNCPAQVCKTVRTEVLPLVGLPTGFSPNGDGKNDILYVRGAAISKLDLKIFNRWGQLVFETRSQDIGWDGTFNGEPQPVEAYAYVLEVWFIDETYKQLQGNITLLR